ncbi:MAG: F0F1 ATP synthase subunit B [Vampirovibrionia bacterium]
MYNTFYLILASAESAGHEAAKHAPPGIFDLIIHSNIVNIAIAFAIIAWAVKKFNLLGGIDDSQKKIIDELRSSEKTKENALKQLEDAEIRLGKAKEEADLIIKNAEKLAAKIKEDITAEAERDAERILLQAQKAIQNEKEQAKAEIQKNLTAAALEVAKDNIRDSLDENWHKSIINDFVNNLSNVKVN